MTASARPRGSAPTAARSRSDTDDGTVDLIDAQTLRRRRSVRALDGFAAAVAFSPDGHLLAVAGEGGQVTLWDARTLQPAGELSGLSTIVQALAFSPDGSRLAAAELGTEAIAGDASINGASVRVWDVRRRALTGVRFATVVGLGRLQPRRPAARRRRALAAHRGPRRAQRPARRDGSATPDCGRSLAFSPDGALLATGHYDGTAQLWSTASWKPVGPPLEGHDERRFLSMDFTPDGACSPPRAQDGTVALYDVRRRTRSDRR